MKRELILIVLSCLSLTGLQAQTRYCMSYADYQADNWEELDSLHVKEMSNGRRLFGCNDYKLTTGNDSLDKVIKKDVFAVFYNDTLLINCRNIHFRGADYEDQTFGNGFTRAYYFYDGRLCFINRWVDEKAMFVGSQGLLGALAASSMSLENARCFLIKREYEGGRIEAQMIGDKFMEKYEESSPEFYAEYMSVKKKKKREVASRVLPLLKEWQLIQ